MPEYWPPPEEREAQQARIASLRRYLLSGALYGLGAFGLMLLQGQPLTFENVAFMIAGAAFIAVLMAWAGWMLERHRRLG